MNENGTNLTERVNLMYKYALQKGLVSSKSEFSDFLGVKQPTLSRFLCGKKEPSTPTLRKFNDRFGGAFREEWLILGKGQMLKEDGDLTPSAREPKPVDPPIGQEPLSSAFAMLVTEMRESRIAKDEQIDRLHTIIEQMQKN